MDEYLSGFEEYLKKWKSASESTLQSYRRDIAQFIGYLKSNGVQGIEIVTAEHIQNYMNMLEEMGRSAATISRFIASIRCFFQYLNRQGVVGVNPASNLKVTRDKRSLPEILTSGEVELLLSQPACEDFKGYRDKAMLEILYATGIRVSELISLNIKDINPDVGVLYCRGEDKVRVIPVYPAAIRCVEEYLRQAGGIFHLDQPDYPLFVNFGGNRLTRQGFWKIVKMYTEQAGIQKRITPHTLRHSFAIHLLENGADLKFIQEMLGHADISSTQVYAQMVKNRYRDVYNKCHPRA